MRCQERCLSIIAQWNHAQRLLGPMGMDNLPSEQRVILLHVGGSCNWLGESPKTPGAVLHT
eukprot:scaffold674578_cov71-Prasinocladus_malaysianus.AAC.1